METETHPPTTNILKYQILNYYIIEMLNGNFSVSVALVVRCCFGPESFRVLSALYGQSMWQRRQNAEPVERQTDEE